MPLFRFSVPLENHCTPKIYEARPGRATLDDQWQTPCATIEAQICTDMQKRGPASSFVRTAPRTFSQRAAVSGAQGIPIAAKATSAESAMNSALSFTDAAEKVLSEFGANRPCTTARSRRPRSSRGGWRRPAKRLPLACTRRSSPNRARQEPWPVPRFVQHGKGYFGLSKWMGRGLAFEIEQHNRRMRQKLHANLLKMSPGEFEDLGGDSWRNSVSKALK